MNNKKIWIIIVVTMVVIIGSLSCSSKSPTSITSVAENSQKTIQVMSLEKTESEFGTSIYGKVAIKIGQEKTANISTAGFDFQLITTITPQEEYSKPSVLTTIKNNSGLVLKFSPNNQSGTFFDQTVYWDENGKPSAKPLLGFMEIKPGQQTEIRSIIPENAKYYEKYFSYTPKK